MCQDYDNFRTIWVIYARSWHFAVVKVPSHLFINQQASGHWKQDQHVPTICGGQKLNNHRPNIFESQTDKKGMTSR